MNAEDFLIAVEFGFKGCEKGWNLEKTLWEFIKVMEGENDKKLDS